MPSVNLYTIKERIGSIERIMPVLREFIAKELSCGDRKLEADEVSLRIIVPEKSLQITNTEL